MSRWIAVAALVWTSAAACGGGGSGVSGSKSLVSLGEGERMALCGYAVEVAGPERTIPCGDGFTVEVGPRPVAECVADLARRQTEFPSCTATVEDSETCTEDLAELTDAQWCAAALPTSCRVVLGDTCGGVIVAD